MITTARARSVHQQRAAYRLARRHGLISTPPKPSRLAPEIKALWVNALRSGLYRQGFGELRQNERSTRKQCYCVLGVLCHVLEPNGFSYAIEDGRKVSRHSFNGKSYQRHHPNQRRMIDLGLYPSMTKCLSLLNDEERKSFSELALFIDAKL